MSETMAAPAPQQRSTQQAAGQQAPGQQAAGQQAAGQRKTATIVVQHGSRDIPLRCFDTQPGRAMVREIMAGDVYRWPAEVPAPKVILDVGANIGAAALWFAMNHPDAQIHCFEAAAVCHPLLEQNLRSVRNATIQGYGLYDRSMALPFFVGREDPLTSSFGHSPLNHEIPEQVTLRQAAEALNELGIDRIDGLKVNTCGSEVPILEGMIHLLPDVAVVFVTYYSEGDRRRIDVMLGQHHMLAGGRVLGAHRGHLVYARRAAYPDARKRDEAAIRMPQRKRDAAAAKAPGGT